MTSSERRLVEGEIENLFDELLGQQEAKTLARARELVPHATADDIANPDDFEALKKDPAFHYEDGITTGLRMAQIALRARVFRA